MLLRCSDTSTQQSVSHTQSTAQRSENLGPWHVPCIYFHGCSTSLPQRSRRLFSLIRSTRSWNPGFPDAGERVMVVRCLLEVGPAHHRGSNFVFALARFAPLTRSGASPISVASSSVAPVPLRIPPSVESSAGTMSYPWAFRPTYLNGWLRGAHAPWRP